jgi:GNAT superfamily N-acetyltransferase
MEFSCVVRFELGWPLIGALVGGELAGVVGLTDIDEKPWPASLADYYQTMTARIGSEAAEWLERYAALADTHKPNAPHYGVGVIGVDPTYQGRGVARALLEWLHGVSDADPRSTGVYLDTETAENVRFYEHLGYQVIGHERLGDLLDIWCMFRPK